MFDELLAKVLPNAGPESLKVNAVNACSAEPLYVGPLIVVLGDEPEVTRARGALTEAKFYIAANDKPQKGREQSVVYAAKSAEAKAREVAAAVPGGATVGSTEDGRVHSSTGSRDGLPYLASS